MEKAILRVEGMSCEHCVKTVTKAVEALPGVKDAKIDLKGATVSFKFEPSKTPLKNIEAAITEAGYTSKGLLKKYEHS
jgi:copper ion binding protein